MAEHPGTNDYHHLTGNTEMWCQMGQAVYINPTSTPTLWRGGGGGNAKPFSVPFYLRPLLSKTAPNTHSSATGTDNVLSPGYGKKMHIWGQKSTAITYR